MSYSSFISRRRFKRLIILHLCHLRVQYPLDHIEHSHSPRLRLHRLSTLHRYYRLIQLLEGRCLNLSDLLLFDLHFTLVLLLLKVRQDLWWLNQHGGGALLVFARLRGWLVCALSWAATLTVWISSESKGNIHIVVVTVRLWRWVLNI